MRVVTGKVIDGKIVVEGAALDEGSTVTVLAADGDGYFELTREDEDALVLALEDADRGDVISAEAVAGRLRRLA